MQAGTARAIDFEGVEAALLTAAWQSRCLRDPHALVVERHGRCVEARLAHPPDAPNAIALSDGRVVVRAMTDADWRLARRRVVVEPFDEGAWDCALAECVPLP